MLFNLFTPKPFHSGYLPADHGHQVFYWQFGNPRGLPVLCFHGGPGYRSHAGQAKAFNLKTHRVILFDQRGCGQSLPRGETAHNTTADLIHDAKRLVDALQLAHMHVYGSSWGSTLALLFAQTYPEIVHKIVITKTFLARARDADWLFQDTAMFYPDIVETLAKPVPPGMTMRAYYAHLMASTDTNDLITATRSFGRYEHIVGTVDANLSDIEPTADEIANFKIYMHYDARNYNLPSDNHILEQMPRIAHIPLLIVHNRLDMICPVEQSWLVHQAHPLSRLVIVPDRGHGSTLLSQTLKTEIAAFLTS